MPGRPAPPNGFAGGYGAADASWGQAQQYPLPPAPTPAVHGPGFMGSPMPVTPAMPAAGPIAAPSYMPGAMPAQMLPPMPAGVPQMSLSAGRRPRRWPPPWRCR